MLYIHPEFRRQGAGRMLTQHVESICQTPKLFTSTNLSNLPMQSLLVKLGYTLSGVIHHPDEDDTELVYVKYLKPSAAQQAHTFDCSTLTAGDALALSDRLTNERRAWK